MKKCIAIIVLIFAVIGSILLFKQKQNSSPQGHNMEQMNGNPIAQSHRSYVMEITSRPVGIDPNQPAFFKFKIKNDKGEVLKNYSVVHTKIMHFIVVRKDLQYFQHLHPEFNKDTGEYSIAITFPTNGPYRLFPDFTPAASEDNPQQLPVTVSTDINVGDLGKYKPQDVVPNTNTVKTVGNYEITYSIPQPVKAGNPVRITLNVAKSGKPVTDMEVYLGAQAHGILLKKDTLDFAHLHAMGSGTTHMMEGQAMTMQGAMSKGPEIKFDYTFPDSGVYKLFTQFQHQGKVITTDDTIEVE